MSDELELTSELLRRATELAERATDVVRMGVAMRDAQQKFFRLRKTSDLILSKRLEKEFDFAAAKLILPPPVVEGELA